MSSAPPRAAIPKLVDLPLVIETAHLRLRPLVEGDVDALWPIVSKADFSKQMSWVAHKDREETVAFIRRCNACIAEGTDAIWAVEYEGHAAGTIGLDGIRWHMGPTRVDRAELGYWLAPSLWNKGFMTEAATAVVRFGFETIGLHKITTRCFDANVASRRVIEKVGFRFIGRAEDDVWRDGEWKTQLFYELTSPEWPDVHTTMRVNRPRPT